MRDASSFRSRTDCEPTSTRAQLVGNVLPSAMIFQLPIARILEVAATIKPAIIMEN